jgi:4,5-dihydroxyphthalate decarboxylase
MSSSSLASKGMMKPKIKQGLPTGVKVNELRDGRTFSQMLADGAIFSAMKPYSMGTSPNVARLVPKFKEVEANYSRHTKISPIMHVVASIKLSSKKKIQLGGG